MSRCQVVAFSEEELLVDAAVHDEAAKMSVSIQVVVRVHHLRSPLCPRTLSHLKTPADCLLLRDAAAAPPRAQLAFLTRPAADVLFKIAGSWSVIGAQTPQNAAAAISRALAAAGRHGSR